MRRCLRTGWLFFTASVCAQLLLGANPHRHAAATVVLANAKDPDSIAIAEAYQAFRGIPEENMLFLPLPKKRDISLREYVDQLLNPLRAALLEREILNGDFVGIPDSLGRKPVFFVENKMRYLVLCRGVPLRIQGSAEADDAAIFEEYLQFYRKQVGQPAFVWPEPFLTKRASVDSELALLAVNRTPITGLVQNPLAGQAPDDSSSPIVRVARLDGPSKEAVLEALEGVRAVERKGLKGRAYFDLRSIKADSTYRIGDDWIEGAAKALETTHMDTDIDRAGAVMKTSARMEAPAVYVGWYANHVTGPFTLEGFRFAPGAIAMHLHSFSAADPQSTKRHWVGRLVEAGAAATLGNVYEPYLGNTHQFQIILGTLVQGANFGDAAYAAVPCLSWQWAVFGDPLYEPFKVGHEAMLPAAQALTDPVLDPYVVIREMNRLLAAGQPQDARDLGIATLEKASHPALALHLARLERQLGKRITARLRLEPFALQETFSAQDWMLYTEIARELDAWEAPDEATQLYRHLIADGRQPRDVKKVLYKEGSAASLWTSADESKVWKERYEAILAEEEAERLAAQAKKEAEQAAKAAAEEKKKAKN